MSVGIMIDNPKNAAEKSIYIPVATEAAFQKYWMKASEELNLKWVPSFQTGIFIEKEDEQIILKEITLVQKWINNLDDIDDRVYLERRISYILKALSNLFEDKVRLYIG